MKLNSEMYLNTILQNGWQDDTEMVKDMTMERLILLSQLSLYIIP